ncbi:flocculation protein FLO11 isoform X2 [Cimex lectularius]|uniref:Chitin-binding type-2 domain-containing protein n=1 Tax=Cimex lectularius TaxID=79782 RepID=A0A8I6TGA3_CIMLE|nr:flocculation protein FLO11 isoform X2 [Cimex lectularius]
MRWHDLWIAAVLLCSVTSGVLSLRGVELVLAAKSKAAEEKLNPTTEEVTVVVGDDGTNSTVVKTKSLLTGIPQKDYIHDPNLPRELKGHNLTDYPFYNSMPEDIEFECDGLHDGFYASVPHHCQVYHHCLFGTRYDFLCANYTAFDQKTFICHFVSEVDCANSPKYYIRNEALYKQSETTPATTKAPSTTPTTTTTTTPAPPRKSVGRRRRPYRRRRPIYEYYYDDDEVYDDEYYDEEADPPPRKTNRRQPRPSGKSGRRRMQHQERKRPSRYEDEYEDEEEERPRVRKGNRKEDDYRHRPSGSMGKGRKGHRDSEEPIPSERPGYISGRGSSRRRYQDERRRPDRDRRPSKEYEYYDEDEEEEYSRYDDEDDRRRPSRGKIEKPRSRPKKLTTTSTTTTTTTTTPKPPPPSTTTLEPYEEEEDEEYEEYDYVEQPKFKPRSKNDNRATTLAPHRFSTTSYRNSKITLSPTSESVTKQKSSAVTFRPRVKSDFKRTTAKPEMFNSHVGSPSGFRKQEEDLKYRRPISELPRRPFPSQTSPSDEVSYRRPQKADISLPLEESKSLSQEFSSSEDQQADTGSFRKSLRPESTPTPSITQPSRNTEDVNHSYKRPVKFEYFQPTATGPDVRNETSLRRPAKTEPLLATNAQESNRKPDNFKSSLKQEQNIPLTGSASIRRPEDNFRRPFKPDAFPITTSEGPSHIFRRPYITTGPEGSRRPNDDPYKRPFKIESEETESDFKNHQSNSRNPDEHNFRQSLQADVRQKPNFKASFTIPTGPEHFKRPALDGMPITAAGYRRGNRPGNKDVKKPLDEPLYQSHRPSPSQEPNQDQGPNYRNPFVNTRPVKEEPEYFKPSKNVEFTAPGPSGEASTQHPILTYDIDEEYDVTLNDALQPSTLNPTLQYTRVKTRGYQSAVTHPSYRSLLLPSASQNYYSKTPLQASEEYEAVVVPAARFTQARYKHRRPAEWYW